MTTPKDPDAPADAPSAGDVANDLDRLTREWRGEASRLEAQITALAGELARVRASGAAAHRHRAQAPARGALATVQAFDIVQLIGAGVLAVAAGSFWFDHRTEPSALLSGLALHVYAIAMIISMAGRLVLIARVDVAGPVLATQTAFARLRRFHLASALTLGLPWWFLWIPCLIILARVALGIDLYARAPAWLWLSMVIGVLGLVGSLALARYLAQRAVTSPALSRWIDLLAGRSLARAAREIDDLTAYADEA